MTLNILEMIFFKYQQGLLMRFRFVTSWTNKPGTRKTKHETQSYLSMIALLLWLPSMSVLAQTEPERYSKLGIGGQAGVPSGLTAKYYFSRDVSIMVVNAWNLDRFLRFSTNMAFEYPIPDSPLHFYVGPGLFFGRENSSKQTDFKSGITLVTGVHFYIEKFEVFLQTNPDVALNPEVSFRLGGVVGLRYFF